ncbi:MAG: SGNH/GDSL hydrolase family protein [Acidobacteria bacterium]|nr:SGNH/GDSL hydrolase family protein [Acidobacteriota bacterium]
MSVIEILMTLALGPALYLQGRYVRRRIPRLPEPRGDRSGRVEAGVNNAPSLRMLIVGDSAAAGVGVGTQDVALSGRLLAELRVDHGLEWRLEARTGATTRQTISRLGRLFPTGQTGFDLLITSLGVNDVTSNVSLNQWLASQRELRQLARERLGVRLLIITAVPPIGLFPALPHPLRWYLGQRANRFNSCLAADLLTEEDTCFLDLRFSLDPTLMAVDGFHPGPVIYAEWARRAASLIRANYAHLQPQLPVPN